MVLQSKTMRMESISSDEGAVLRKEFEKYAFPWVSRHINMERIIAENITNLDSRPAYVPHINIVSTKGFIVDGKFIKPPLLTFVETIYTSNEFLVKFEEFLRNNAAGIEAEGFENIPEMYRHFYETQFTQLTAIVGVKLSAPEELTTAVFQAAAAAHADSNLNVKRVGNTDLEIRTDKFAIDFGVPATLMVIPPDKMNAKLDEIEKAANYTASIEEHDREGLETIRLLAQELREGSESMTLRHYVFREA